MKWYSLKRYTPVGIGNKFLVKTSLDSIFIARLEGSSERRYFTDYEDDAEVVNVTHFSLIMPLEYEE